MIDLSIVLPAFNEERNILKAISNAEAYLRSRFKSFEIIVVNDGSTDSTAAMVTKLAKQKKYLKLVSHSKNQGYGAALRSGFSACQAELIFYTDSDNQYDISELDKLLPNLEWSDIVAGFRIHHNDPLARIIISWIYNQIIWFVLGLKIKDVDCSFKLYKKVVFDSIKLRSNTGLIDAEILINALKKGYRISQVGVNHYPRIAGNSSYEIGKRNKIFAFVNPRVPVEIFKEINKYWKDLK